MNGVPIYNNVKTYLAQTARYLANFSYLCKKSFDSISLISDESNFGEYKILNIRRLMRTRQAASLAGDESN